MRAHLTLVSIIVLGLSACGGDNTSPTSPTPMPPPSPTPMPPPSPTPMPPQPVIPNVAGTYRGPLTLSALIEGSMVSSSGTMSMTVAQAGAQLTITGSTVLSDTSDLGIINATIDTDGRVTFPADTFQEEDPDQVCSTNTVATLTFTGNIAVFNLAQSDDCGNNAEMSSTLTRQGDNTSPPSPTPMPPQPVIPNVAGTYRGPLTLSALIEGSMVSSSGTMSMTVAQDGAQLAITGSYEVVGETTDLGTISGTIDAAGRVTLTAPDEEDPDCGTIMEAIITLTFTGNMVVFRTTATTSVCGPIELSATLTRQ